MTEQKIQQHHPFTQECSMQTTSEGKLAGYTLSVKDAIWVKGIESTASSHMLKGFKPLEHATVVEKVLFQGATIIGKTVQDEFGFGSFCTQPGIGFTIPTNPHDETRCTGGSSGGAAVATAIIDKHLAISESTGGSIVTPAAFCGVVGLCPTYGLVSRYGLISYASSLDKIGAMAKTVREAALLLEVLAGYDVKDETSQDKKVEPYSTYTKSTKQKRIALLEVDGVDEHIQKRFQEIIKRLQEQGMKVDVVSLPYTTKYALSAYYVIAMSEASTHLACLGGLRYGLTTELDKPCEEYFSTTRHAGFGDEAKRRILLGTFMRMSGFRDQYYAKALKVRTQIQKEYATLFQKYDVIVTPTTPTVAPKFEDIKKLSAQQQYAFDFLTVGPNIAGLPHITIPIHGEKELPYGLQFIAQQFDEKTIIELGLLVEELR